MAKVIVVLVFVIVILVFLFIKKARECSAKNDLKYAVAWCATKNSSIHRCNLRLHEYISNAQIELNLLQEYRLITDSEWNLVKEIILSFQEELAQNFFSDTLTIPTSKYVISGKAYFMYLLQNWLEKHQCDYTFLKHDMHAKTLSRKDYGSWGGPLYDATYELTDFAVVMHKLYYVSYMYCKNDCALNPTGEHWTGEHAIEDIIDSKRISISRM